MVTLGGVTSFGNDFVLPQPLSLSLWAAVRPPGDFKAKEQS